MPITLDYIAETYVTLMENAEASFLSGQLTEYPRGAKIILKFLSGYTGQMYKIKRVDFYRVDGASPEAEALRPDDRDVFSIVRIDKRPASGSHRPVHIYVNIGESTHEEVVLNRCWGRFCLVKEACQALIFESFTEDNDIDAAYPVTADYKGIRRLVDAIEDEPYSLHDFENQSYSLEQNVENSAELLAIGLMVGFEGLYDLQSRVKKELAGDLTRLDTLEIAADHAVPLRYIELFLRWDRLGELCAKIDTYRAS